MRILSGAIYEGFGPTLACEYLRKKHQLAVSKETLRKWLIKAGLWKAKQQKVELVHAWRPRRSRCGELVQWDTSEHDWLEGRGERIYLIAMIDDASSRMYARLVRCDSTEENMRVLWRYLELYGRPVAFYTDKASLFRRRTSAGATSPEWTKTLSRWRRRRSGARCKSWAWPGFRRTVRRPKGAWSGDSPRHRTGW